MIPVQACQEFTSGETCASLSFHLIRPFQWFCVFPFRSLLVSVFSKGDVDPIPFGPSRFETDGNATALIHLRTFLRTKLGFPCLGMKVSASPFVPPLFLYYCTPGFLPFRINLPEVCDPSFS